MRSVPASEVVLELLACKCSQVCKLHDCIHAWSMVSHALISANSRPAPAKQCSIRNPTLSRILKIQRMSKRYSKMSRYKRFWRSYGCIINLSCGFTNFHSDSQTSLHMVETSLFISNNVFTFISFNLMLAYCYCVHISK